MKLCMAFRHVTKGGSLLKGRSQGREIGAIVLVPCRGRTDRQSRFCREHERAYREILFGIFEEARNIPHRER